MGIPSSQFYTHWQNNTGKFMQPQFKVLRIQVYKSTAQSDCAGI